MSDQSVSALSPQPWFVTARQPPMVLYFKINRRDLTQGNMLSTTPPDFLDHLMQVLLFGTVVETGTAKKRSWRLGNRDVDLANRVLSGRIGFESLARTEQNDYNEETESWEEEETLVERKVAAPFAIDADTEYLVVVQHPAFSARSIAAVFTRLLTRGENAREVATSEWSVENRMDDKDFRQWLAGAEAIQEVKFTARVPNPDGLAEFGPAWEELKQREAAVIQHRLQAKNPKTGLKGLQGDPQVEGYINMASHGYARIQGKRRRNNKQDTFDSANQTRRTRLQAFAENWADLRRMVVDLVQGERSANGS